VKNMINWKSKITTKYTLNITNFDKLNLTKLYDGVRFWLELNFATALDA